MGSVEVREGSAVEKGNGGGREGKDFSDEGAGKGRGVGGGWFGREIVFGERYYVCGGECGVEQVEPVADECVKLGVVGIG